MFIISQFPVLAPAWLRNANLDVLGAKGIRLTARPALTASIARAYIPAEIMLQVRNEVARVTKFLTREKLQMQEYHVAA
jgi:hypothetical protein